MKIQNNLCKALKSFGCFHYFRMYTFFFILFANFLVSAEEWVSVGPKGGNFDFVKIHPLQTDHIYTFNSPCQGDFSQVFIDFFDGSCGGVGNISLSFSTDKGRTWELVQKGSISDPQPSYIGGTQWIGNPNIIFGEKLGVLYDIQPPLYDNLNNKFLNASITKSTDHGRSWETIGEFPTITLETDKVTDVSRLVVDPNNRLKLYGIAGYQTDQEFRNGRTFSYYWKHALVRSEDGGVTWSIISPLFDSYVPSLSILPDTHSTLYVAANFGLYKSIDAGLNWQQLYQAEPYPCDYSIDQYCGKAGVEDIKISPANRNIIYILARSQSFYQYLRSDDGGMKWKVIFNFPSPSPGISVDRLVPSPQDENVVYAYGSMYNSTTESHVPIIGRSTDKGKTWQIIDIDLTKYFTINDLSIDPSDNKIIYLTIDGEVFISRDGLQTIQRPDIDARLVGGALFFGKTDSTKYVMGDDG